MSTFDQRPLAEDERKSVDDERKDVDEKSEAGEGDRADAVPVPASVVVPLPIPLDDSDPDADSPSTPNALASLHPRRKIILMLCFCLSQFIDSAGTAAAFLMTAPIASSLNIEQGNQPWILASYSLSFAATLLFAGRLADLYPPSIVYVAGFLGLGIFYLVISFVKDQYTFFVLRALSAGAGVLAIPTSVNMIVQMFPESTQQAKMLAMFGMSGALGNTSAFILAGLFLLLDWRWYFRFIAFLVIPFALLAFFLMPKTEAVTKSASAKEKWRRMDLGGVFILMAMMVLFILAFTQATVDGWKSAIFIAPLIISIALVPVFVVWERTRPEGYALLPRNIWSFPNIFPLILLAASGFLWFATYQLGVATWYQDVLHDSPIITAVKILPMGIVSIAIGPFFHWFPSLVLKPRFVQPVASLLMFTGSMLLAFSNGGRHMGDYWKYIFTGGMIGTTGEMINYIGTNTAIIQSFPREFAGVGGSFAAVIYQIGGVVGIAVQAALLPTGGGVPGHVWAGYAHGYYFTSGVMVAIGLLFVLWYRQSKMPNGDKEAEVDGVAELPSDRPWADAKASAV
ncbi:hypothetical protein Q8F55_004686 [Vanrija albida]|uniref:Major facilitator superfamily (MFS) profile domain-containing protein n=1 Tax=Vanrija albida TaxID=181172 RepID=A0ABR3Q7P5_9TREE